MCLCCSGTEQKFMQASMAAAAGKPMMSDEEYDGLKAELRNKNSRVVQQASLPTAQPFLYYHQTYANDI